MKGLNLRVHVNVQYMAMYVRYMFSIYFTILLSLRPWGPPCIKIGGAQVKTDKYTVYTVYKGGARIFVRGGNIKQNFIHEFLSSPVLQWRRQKFASGGHSAKMYSSKTFEKFWKILKKKFAQKFKNSPKFFQNKIQ